MRRDLVQLVRNFTLSLGGEGLQSAFHFALSLVLIRLLSAHEFGVFAIAFVLGGIALTYGNAFISVPAAVRLTPFSGRPAVKYLDAVFGAIALLVSVAIGTVAFLILWLLARDITEALAGGMFTGLWALRNHLRTTLFARRLMARAVASDIAYVVTGIELVSSALWLMDFALVTVVLSALALANLVGIIIALRGARPRVTLRLAVWRRYRAIWPDVAWSLVSATTWNVQSQALTFLVAIFAGPAAYAPVAAAIVLFSPMRPAMSAVVNVFRPEFAAALAGGHYRRARLTLYSLCGIIALSCIAAGTVVWLGWPLIQTYIFAGKFAADPMPLIVALTGLQVLVYSTYNGPIALVQAATNFKPVAIASTVGGIVGLVSVSILLAFTSVAWSLAGVVAGELACFICLWIASQRILRDEHHAEALPGSATRAAA